MTEEEKKEEPKEPLGEDKVEDETSTTTTIDEANRAADRLSRENDRRHQLLLREEKLAVERKLGGQSEAGAIPAKAKEETAVEYKNRVMSGQV